MLENILNLFAIIIMASSAILFILNLGGYKPKNGIWKLNSDVPIESDKELKIYSFYRFLVKIMVTLTALLFGSLLSSLMWLL